MPENPESILEKKVGEYEKLLKPEEAVKREDLGWSVTEAFRGSFNKWLMKKHGSHKLPDGTEVPLHYSLGDYDKATKSFQFVDRDVDDLLNYVGENMLSYVFHDEYKKNPGEFKKLSATIKKAGLLQGILTDKFFGEKGMRELKTDLFQHHNNILRSADFPKLLAGAGHGFAEAEVREIKSDIESYGQDLPKKLYGLAERSFGKSPYGIKTEGMSAKEVTQMLGHLYKGEISESSIEQPGGIGKNIYKKSEYKKAA